MVVEVGAADTAEEAEATGAATGVGAAAGIAIAAATVTEFILFGYAKARRLRPARFFVSLPTTFRFELSVRAQTR